MYTFDSGAMLLIHRNNRSSHSVCYRVGAEISSPSSLYFKAVKGAHIGSALTGATSELTNSNCKKNSHKTHFSLLRKKSRTRLHSLLLFIYLKFKKKGNTASTKQKSLTPKQKN